MGLSLSLNKFLAGAAATQAGWLKGQADANLYNQQQDDAALNMALQQADRQQQIKDSQLNHLGNILSSGMLDPNSDAFNQMSQQYLQGVQGYGQGPNVGAFMDPNGRAARAAQRRGLTFAQPQPDAMPAASPAPATGGNPFLGKAGMQAIQDLDGSLRSTEQMAMQQGDSETAGAARALRQKLTLRQITPQEALQQANALEVQGNAVGKFLNDWDNAKKELYGAIGSGRVADENKAEANQILAAMKRLGVPATKAARDQAQQVLGQYSDFIGKGGVGEDPNAAAMRDYRANLTQTATDRVAAQKQSQATTSNSRLLRIIESAKGNPQRFLDAVAQQRAFAAQQPTEYGIIPYGEDRYDSTPQSKQLPQDDRQMGPASTGPDTGTPQGRVFQASLQQLPEMTRTETPEEVRARLLQNASDETQDPKDKQKYASAAVKSLMQVFNGKRWGTLSDDEKDSVLDRIATISEGAGLPDPLEAGIRGDQLPPDVKQRLQQRETQLSIARQNANTATARVLEMQRHDRETENLKQKSGTALATPGALTTAQKAQLALISKDRQALDMEARQLGMMKEYLRSPRQAQRYQEIVGPGGLLDQNRQQADAILGPALQAKPQPPAGKSNTPGTNQQGYWLNVLRQNSAATYNELMNKSGGKATDDQAKQVLAGLKKGLK